MAWHWPYIAIFWTPEANSILHAPLVQGRLWPCTNRIARSSSLPGALRFSAPFAFLALCLPMGTFGLVRPASHECRPLSPSTSPRLSSSTLPPEGRPCPFSTRIFREPPVSLVKKMLLTREGEGSPSARHSIHYPVPIQRHQRNSAGFQISRGPPRGASARSGGIYIEVVFGKKEILFGPLPSLLCGSSTARPFPLGGS